MITHDTCGSIHSNPKMKCSIAFCNGRPKLKNPLGENSQTTLKDLTSPKLKQTPKIQLPEDPNDEENLQNSMASRSICAVKNQANQLQWKKQLPVQKKPEWMQAMETEMKSLKEN